MNIIQTSQAKKIQASPTTAIWEFEMEEKAISGAIAEINGRYPEKGFAVNKDSKELSFIISGEGYIVTPTQKRPIHVGDLVFVDKGDLFAWETKKSLTLFMANTPKFDPKQHIIIP